LQDTADYPSVGATLEQKTDAIDFEPVLKIFTPDGNAPWLLTELDPNGANLVFGLCALGHMFAPLVRGKIIADRIVECPFHRARFDIRTGQVVEWANFPPGIQLLNVIRGQKVLRTFEVSVEGGNVQVDIPTT
jgi:nitrite reductase/ring-hydroxylating ferredoxin subunit